MSKKFFVWKNAAGDGADKEWIEMTGREFYQFIKRPENRHRCFMKLGTPFVRRTISSTSRLRWNSTGHGGKSKTHIII